MQFVIESTKISDVQQSIVGYVKLKARGSVEIPAGSTKQVDGVVRNKCGKSVTGLLDSFISNTLPGGVVVSYQQKLRFASQIKTRMYCSGCLLDIVGK